jgi:hypothetical protein
MALKRVHQAKTDGCFIASVATLTGKTYKEAFNLVYPKRDIRYAGTHNIVDFSLEDAIVEKLEEMGLKVRRSKLRDLNVLRRRKTPAILLIRWWPNDPDDMEHHCVVYDPDSKELIDPAFRKPYKNRIYEKRIVGLVYVNIGAMTND